MKVGVIGTGYVGLVAATCFADSGHSVTCVDSNAEKLATLKSGRVPFFEPGLEELFARVKNRMRFVSDIRDVVKDCEVVFVAVGTPELPDGSADTGPTFKALHEICVTAPATRYVVFKSTVPIGTSVRANAYVREHSRQTVEIISNPEFLRQGMALEDFQNPDRIIVGCHTDAAKEIMRELYQPFLKNESDLLFMDGTSAEMVKYAANSFLALKISFINELALLADELGADIDCVRDGFTSDNRINPAFFQPGIGYGGSCFPKDVRALTHTARQVGMEMKILKAADEVNERQKSVLTERLHKHFGDLRGLKIAIWGLAFKPRTDDVRRAPSIQIIESLVRAGATVRAYDPVAVANAKQASLAGFETATSALAATKGADALMILTEWSEFKSVDLDELRASLRQPVVFDGRNMFDPDKMIEHKLEYICIGRNRKTTDQEKPLRGTDLSQ